MSNTILSCRNLTKTFFDAENRVDVLLGVDLQIKERESLAVLGVSGSGKSTLLHLLGGLDQPTEGEVFWNDQDVSTFSETQKCKMRNRHLGFVYQFHHLLPEFTAIENVAMPLLIRGVSSSEALHEANECLKKLGLAERTKHKLSELSGGERQRTAIARAIVTKPKCVLADEPTGNLDNQTAHDVLEAMLLLQEEFNTSFIIVTHNLLLAKKLQSSYSLQQGKLIRS